MKHRWKGHKDRNRHKNRTKRRRTLSSFVKSSRRRVKRTRTVDTFLASTSSACNIRALTFQNYWCAWFCLQAPVVCWTLVAGGRDATGILISDNQGVMQSCRADSRTQLWYSGTPAEKQTKHLMRGYPGERPLTMMRDHPNERPPRWEITHCDERPPWWKITLMRDRPDERPP